MVFAIWFGDIKKAKTMAIIMGITTAILIILALFAFIVQLYKILSYEHMEAVITDFDTRDSNNVWTEFSYVIGEKLYTTRVKGHSFQMRIDSQINILVNKKNPGQAEILRDNPYLISLIILVAAVIFGLFFLLYLLNYRSLKKKQQAPAT